MMDRFSPKAKRKVNCWQCQGEVVPLWGDKTNEHESLKEKGCIVGVWYCPICNAQLIGVNDG